MEKRFCRKIISDSIFSDYELVFAKFLSKSLIFPSGLSKLQYSYPSEHFERFFLKIFQIFVCFWTLSWKFLDFGIKIWPLLSLLQVTFPREKTTLKNFGSSLQFLMWRAFYWFFSKKVKSFAKTAFYLLPV